GTAPHEIATANSKRRIVVMVRSSVLVGAVGAQAQDVLDEPLVVRDAGLHLRSRKLQAQAAEFRRAVVEHHGRAPRLEGACLEEGAVRSEIDRARVEAIV